MLVELDYLIENSGYFTFLGFFVVLLVCFRGIVDSDGFSLQSLLNKSYASLTLTLP